MKKTKVSKTIESSPGSMEFETIKETDIVSKHNFFTGSRPGWKTKQKSLTFPGRTLTLRQIADRFANGLNNPDEKIALYDNDRVVIKDFNKLDLTERMEIVKDAEEKFRELMNKRQVEQKKKRETAFTDEIQKQVDIRLKEIAEKKIKDNP